MKKQAQCLCGAVSLNAEHDGKLTACHCNKCRTWNGGAVFAMNGYQLDIQGVEHIARYRSSEWAERCFCKQCGTHLFVQTGDRYLLNPGLFADNADFTLETQIFIDRKAPYYELTNNTPKLTESEFLAIVNSAK